MAMSYRRKTVLDLLCEDMPPRFFPVGTPFPFKEPGRCSWCGMLVQSPRRSWCSQECVEEWTVRSSAAWVRSLVWKRDHGVCAACGVEAPRIQSCWDADHIVPVWRGGGLCGLDGYQTLCRECHAVKTADDAAERAAERRPPAEPAEPSRQLAMVCDCEAVA